MEIKNTTGQLIDGIFASEALDSSGEILDITGLDISDFDEGRGTANYEHQNSDDIKNQGQEIVGKIIYAKKIFKASDCSSEREKLFWEKVKPLPFLYGVVRLYDGAGHEGAKALAAIIRDSHANNEPLVVGFSIEGSTLEKDSKTNRLKSTIARRVAITLRPCNKTAVAALLADPNAPKGFSEGVAPDVIAMVTGSKTEKKELIDPQFTRLGGSEAIYGTEVFKALTAGSYNAAPSALVGGAALQVEDRGPKARAIKALNDWKKYAKKDPKGKEFKEFLKAQLPDVSDEFLDHFTQIVDDHMFKVKKAQEVVDSLKKAGKEVKKPKPNQSATPKLTIRGQPAAKPSKEVFFDETKGVLRTPRGSFPMYIPSYHDADKGDTYRKLLDSGPVSKFHDVAMENFVHAQKLFKSGQVPREMIAHAVMFSNLSPNTPVPVQEMMYGHLKDAMDATGVSPVNPQGNMVTATSPGGKEYTIHESNKRLLEDWMRRDDPNKLPDHSPKHWERLKNTLSLKNDSKLSGRLKGQFAAFQLPWDKFGNISNLHNFVDGIGELISQHRNGRAVSEALLGHKHANGLHEARREAALARGEPDIGPYTAGPVIKGLAPKTVRYALGMLGAGDVQVPDTHHVRHIFGLDRNADTPSIDYIKSLLWEERRGAPILAAMDRYYAQHHDAVKHMLQHPKWGQHFQSPEDAIFPAFWKGWTAIVPHEKSRGLKTYGFNEGTDHLPYWEAVQQFFKSEGVYNPNLSYDTAVQHLKWTHDLGPIAAMRLYYTHLVPLLIKNEQARSIVNVRKFEEVHVDTVVLLAKALSKAKQRPRVHTKLDEEDEPTPSSHPIASNAVPGFNDLPHSQEVLNSGLDLEQHQVSLNTGSEGGIGGSASRKQVSYWTRAPDGKHYYVKGNYPATENEFGPDYSEPHREAIYANLAHNFFGLGKYVPNVALVKNQNLQPVAVIEGVPGKNYFGGSSKLYEALKPYHENGEIHKILGMNFVMGNGDRHSGNFLIHPEDGLKLVDHGITLHDYYGPSSPGGMYTPEYLNDDKPKYDPVSNKQLPSIHPEAQKWAAGLSEETLRENLGKYSLIPKEIDKAVGRLKALKHVYANEAHHPFSSEQIWGRLHDVYNAPKTDDRGVRFSPES